MTKKETVKIMEPYWSKFLEKNGVIEREIHLEKFINSVREMSKFSFANLLVLKKYLSFILFQHLNTWRFWITSKEIAEIKKEEDKIGDFMLKMKHQLTDHDREKLESLKQDYQDAFTNNLNVFFKEILKSPTKEERLWCAHLMIEGIKKFKGG